MTHSETEKRAYPRHPFDVPLQVEPSEPLADCVPSERIRDVGIGGICFLTDRSYPIGEIVKVTIPVTSPPFETRCGVAWCRPVGDIYEVGVEILEVDKQCRARMVEQICQIEHYRKAMSQHEGRTLTSGEAALEWIKKYAAEFPRG